MLCWGSAKHLVAWSVRGAVGDSEEESSEFGAWSLRAAAVVPQGAVCVHLFWLRLAASSAYLLREGEKTQVSETNWKEDNSNRKSWKESLRLVLCPPVTQAIAALPLLSIRVVFFPLIVSCMELPSSKTDTCAGESAVCSVCC